MGQGHGKALRSKEAQELSRSTIFTTSEIKTLYRRFQSVSESIQNDGVIDLNEFRHYLGSDSVIASRVFSVLDDNGDGVIEFSEFVKAMSILIGNEMEEKIKFCFKIYDVNRDGTIAANELEEMVKATVFNNLYIYLSDDEVHKLVMDTFNETDADGDGNINYAEFSELVHKYPNIVNLLTIDRDVLRMGDVYGSDGSDYGSGVDSDSGPSPHPSPSPSPLRDSSGAMVTSPAPSPASRLLPAPSTPSAISRGLRDSQSLTFVLPSPSSNSYSSKMKFKKHNTLDTSTNTPSASPNPSPSPSPVFQSTSFSNFPKLSSSKPECACEGSGVCTSCKRSLGSSGGLPPLSLDHTEYDLPNTKREKEKEEAL